MVKHITDQYLWLIYKKKKKLNVLEPENYFCNNFSLITNLFTKRVFNIGENLILCFFVMKSILFLNLKKQ